MIGIDISIKPAQVPGWTYIMATHKVTGNCSGFIIRAPFDEFETWPEETMKEAMQEIEWVMRGSGRHVPTPKAMADQIAADYQNRHYHGD